ncbi:Protein of unknown function [Monaibacterium marinum]|uniref:DUF1153 domain-containing protein n=1 Tax=Pontivivens marinum TaxID=1690039 RepID=A0A2C9CT35_9RHOB|nr:DUF1153 domain-containing protein [Monaibacterium marinum]SOH94422.1 Protein of unknown function [Monaibacterium marinum]
MYLKRTDRPILVKDHSGRSIARNDLPPPETKRWVARRKAMVVAAVDGGMLTLQEACELYDLSEEELGQWRDALSKHGLNALRVTAMQRYRKGADT